MRKAMSHHLRVAAACLVVGAILGAVALPAAGATTSTTLQPCQTQNSGAYPPGSGQIGLQTSSEQAGQSNVVAGSGFAKSGQTGALGTVALQICSNPESLGTATLAGDGTFSQQVTIPADITPGQHVVQAQGPNGQGGTLTLLTRLTITAPASTGSGSGAGGGNTSLPFTGFDLVPLVLAAVLLLVTGGSLVVVTRERARRRTTA